ncbi:anoctamin-8-like isoform X2 [Tigriopus californicus]|uniref:anoctamin-8-like isoform X2 n=1 Tax=Tigriopus californicus TaxID=6832 RepID=UPI0027DA0D3B|nr:anoctamin-8-like isoform X2 [Tigriopus californicus]
MADGDIDELVDVVVLFPPKSTDECVEFIKRKLECLSEIKTKENRFQSGKSNKSGAEQVAFTVVVTNQGLLRGLEILQIPKEISPNEGGGLRPFSVDKVNQFLNVNDKCFATSEERQAVAFWFLNSIRAVEGDSLGSFKFRIGEAIIPRCLNKSFLAQVYPLHDAQDLKYLRSQWVRKFFSPQPLDKIREYFGIKIGFYFSWLGHYTSSLAIQALAGIFISCLSDTEDGAWENVLFISFALFNVIWSTLYLSSWKRRSEELSFQWGTSDEPCELLQDARPMFKGEEVVSSITGKNDLHYPNWKRSLIRYCVSLPIMIISLIIVTIVMFFILELQQQCDYLIKYEGYVTIMKYVPKLLLAIAIPAMDSVYGEVAVFLNDLENFRLESQYEDNLIIKLVLFQFVNSFLALFYTAFYLRDMDKLRELLATLLITRQLIGNMKESIIPYIKQQFKQAEPNMAIVKRTKQAYAKYKKSDGDDDTGKGQLDEGTETKSVRRVSQAELECQAPKYDGTFEDYLEMLIQFGYVALFSSAYPLAGFWAFFNNVMEIRGDAFKLCSVHQRPFGERVQNIGPWQQAMELIGIIGIMVNCALIGISSQAMLNQSAVEFNQNVLLIVCLEHVMIFLKLTLSHVIPDSPVWIMEEKAKIEFRRRKLEQSFLQEKPITPATASQLKPLARTIRIGAQDRGTQTDVVKSSRQTLSVEEIEAINFRKKVSNSVSDIFKTTSARGLMESETALTPNKLSTHDEEISSLRKRSCPNPQSTAIAESTTKTHEDSPRDDYFNANSPLVLTTKADAVDHHHTDPHPRRLKMRMASDTNLFSSLRVHGDRYAKISNNFHENELGGNHVPTREKILINQVHMPTEVQPSTPTPVSPPLALEDNKGLKAKRALFSKGRSLSLASFRGSVPKAPKKFKPFVLSQSKNEGSHHSQAKLDPVIPEDEAYLMEHQAKGELDLLNLESLINMNDVNKTNTHRRPKIVRTEY